MRYYVGWLFLSWGIALVGTGTPGMNLWQLIDKLCSVVEVNDSVLDSSLDSVYNLATDIDAHLDNLTGSSLSIVVSSLEQLTSTLIRASSITESVVSNVETLSTQLESLMGAITVLENLDMLVIGGTCSCLDLAMQSTTEAVGSDLDLLRTGLDNCCSNLSLFDVLIKSDVDSVSVKVDSISSQLSGVQSGLDQSCSVISSVYVCLVGKAITQSMIPYTIIAPGNYYLSECVTTASSNPAITIATNDVYLNLNGNTITSTGGVGISCTGYNTIYIENGSIIPLTEAVLINGGANVTVNNIMIINAGAFPLAFAEVTDFVIENCIIHGTTDPGSSGFAMLLSGPGKIINCLSYNQTFFSYYIDTCPAVDFIDCVSIGSVFYIFGSTESGTVRNCITTDSPSNGFTTQSSGNLLFVNCIARMCAQGGFGAANNDFQAIYKNCVSNDNAQTGFWCFEANVINPVFEDSLANNNGMYGFNVEPDIADPVCERCTATNNGTNGFLINTATKAILNRCIAAGNASAGIDNNVASTTIVDCRSQHSATLVNPAYNLNGAIDVIGGATQIIIS